MPQERSPLVMSFHCKGAGNLGKWIFPGFSAGQLNKRTQAAKELMVSAFCLIELHFSAIAALMRFVRYTGEGKRCVGKDNKDRAAAKLHMRQHRRPALKAHHHREYP